MDKTLREIRYQIDHYDEVKMHNGPYFVNMYTEDCLGSKQHIQYSQNGC